MPRPHRIFEEHVGHNRDISAERMAEESGTSETTVWNWRREDEKREPSFTDLQNIAGSTLLPTTFKLALVNEMLRFSRDVRVVPCGEAAQTDALPMSVSIVVAECVNNIQQIIDEATHPQSSGGPKFCSNEANRLATARAKADVEWTRLWASIERQTLRPQTRTA